MRTTKGYPDSGLLRVVEHEASEQTSKRATWRALQGVLLSGIVPFSWLMLQWAHGASPLHELGTRPFFYLYIWMGALVATSLLGLIMGRREEALLAVARTLARNSWMDELTGLKNGRYMRERALKQVDRAERDTPISLILFDLDHFKHVNDTYGHVRGDEVLRRLGHVTREIVRKGDVAARVGGEEFVVILMGAGEESAYRVAERLRQRIKQERFEAPGLSEPFSVSLSAGVVSAPSDTVIFEQLYEQADQALYQAKRAGRDRVCVGQYALEPTAATPRDGVDGISSALKRG